MKKVFLVLPLAIMLANCSSTRNSAGNTASAGMNTSGTNADASVTSTTSASGQSGSAGVSGSASSNSSGNLSTNTNYSASQVSNKGNGSKSGGAINWDVYDPNNFMQNPDKYLRPDQLGKSGGWTYNKDWRRNTNFSADAVGQWQLVLTPEVAANWLPDTRRPETYASFWTPEAVMARYQATMAAMAKTRDSLAALTAAADAANNLNKKGKKGTNTASLAATVDTTSIAATGNGSTGAMGTGGVSATNNTDSANNTNGNSMVPFTMRAVNGNNFLLPTLNMYIDNGSFTAYTGCNSAVGSIVVNGNTLKFEEAAPVSNVECIGGFDQSAFLERLRRADSYDVVNNQFRLKQGNEVLMVFAKRAL